MKKTLALLLTIILTFTCFTIAASAANSPEIDGVVTSATAVDAQNKKSDIKLEKLSGGIQSGFTTALGSLKTETSKDLKIVDQRKLVVSGNPTFPVTVTFNVLGVNANSTGYILIKKADGTVEKVQATMGKGTMTVKFDSAVEFAVVVDADTAAAIVAANKEGTSDKTSDNNAASVALLLVFVSVLAAGYSIKKIRA